MHPDLMKCAIDTADALRGIAKDKRRRDDTRMGAADILVGLLHSLAELQHNINDRALAEQFAEMHDDYDPPESWRS